MGTWTAVAVACGLVITAPARSKDASPSFEIYGFAQADYIQDTKRVDPSWQDAFRPSKIAVPEGQFGSNGQADLSVKQSRLGVRGTLPTAADSPPINFKFEIDMFGVGVDAGQTTLRLRHAYGEWGPLLAGQTHSLFMDIDVYPNTIDYWGPSGMVFNRDPQIRWTFLHTGSDQFAIAIERPSNDVDPGDIRLIEQFQNATVRGDQTVPDFTAMYRADRAWGHVQFSGLLRRVGYEFQATPAQPFRKGSQTGWGLFASAAWKTFGKDQLLLQVVHGDGIATYMNDGGMDLAPNANFDPLAPAPTLSAEAVPLTGVVAYYDHWWSSRWSSSIGYSFTQVSNTNFQTPDTFHKSDYASVNLLMHPVEQVLVGAELLWGRRTNSDGTTGDDVRFQFSVKYDFGTKL
ncbi:MAG TPA: DcaP family trimeric outer membrane transporter [Steroidobacteraceae bacterium]|jgi:hypothetical protein